HAAGHSASCHGRFAHQESGSGQDAGGDMIIDVKATRQSATEPDPSQKYVLKSMEKKSKTPFVLGVLLASFVLYFKSFLSSSESAAIAEDENADRHGDPEGDLREQEMAA